MDRKFHYYSFSFIDSARIGVSYASVYIGYTVNYISKPQLEEAKKDAGVSKTATLLSCCYLGEMTRDQMINGPGYLSKE